MYGGIEAGGTKFICAVSNEGVIVERVSIPTTTPEETLKQVFDFFDQYELEALGIGSFGPIGIDKNADNYGYVLATPKPGWENYNFLGSIQERYGIPMAWTTDVNAAAYGELLKGAAQGKKSCIYLTVGTGIGAGVVLEGDIFSGLAHPEMGHIWVKRHPEDTYEGTCPYHKDCLEGLAAGPSIEARTGIKGQELPQDHPIWDIQAYYIAQALINYTLMLAPEKIILGGGVMNQDHLLHKIRQQFVELMGGYMETPQVDEYIVRWGLPNESGIIGSLLLAEKEHGKQ
ncbi:ROK family protein [Enterococcus hirae]|uniref:ROK family protein n=1 Tax=Enterococcus hirae TaxID=1354 RepID=UPI0013644321|nr:ROK family protein [Enterococcus hirae]EMF0169915.1 ROK family protein [Enterococcus hirae]EMF0424155.1 ROK family protein [Enterococcus hirae]MCD4958108.1 ROK family protein [Enterococcus hirae]MDT2653634.1 ROK family protein [Enterococcus hirae]NBJ44424.1 ROK family protein [Enterococcus hirae]